MNYLFRTSSIFFIIILTACNHASGPTFSPISNIPEEKALVYLYRDHIARGAGAVHKIFINEEHITDMHAGGYYASLVTPGKVVIGWELKPAPGIILDGLLSQYTEALDFEVEPEKTYFVKCELGWNGYEIYLVDNGTGTAEISNLKLSEK